MCYTACNKNGYNHLVTSSTPFVYAAAARTDEQAFARADMGEQLATQMAEGSFAVHGLSGTPRSGKTTLLEMTARLMMGSLVIIDCGQSHSPGALAIALRRALTAAGGELAAVAAAAAPVAPTADPLADLIAAAETDASVVDEIAGLLNDLAALGSAPALALDNAHGLAAWSGAELKQLAAELSDYGHPVCIASTAEILKDLMTAMSIKLTSTVDLDSEAAASGEGEVAAGIVALADGFDALAAQAVARLARCHLKSCQQLADLAWQMSPGAVDIDVVRAAWAKLLESEHLDFSSVFTQLATGSAQDQRLGRIMCLVADNAGSRLRSDDLASRYAIGASGRMAIQRDLKRLATQGLAQQRGHTWHLTDPLLEAWLRARSSWT